MSRFWRPEPDGLTLFVRVTANAGGDAIDGPERRDDGSEVLRVRVRAVPERGRANAAVIALLASALGVSRSSLRVVTGETARLKTLRVGGDPGALALALAKLG